MKKYQVLYIDPPWSYNTNGAPASHRPCLDKGDKPHSVNHYYKTMSLNDIKTLPIQNLTDKNAIIFMWATNPLLPEAFEVLKSWNLKYKTCFTWHKINSKGMGYWFRGYTEHLLLAIKGNVKAFRCLEPNFKSTKVGKHSEKPVFFRELIEDVTSDYPAKLEMFARNEVSLFSEQFNQKWDFFGNEAKNSIDLSAYQS